MNSVLAKGFRIALWVVLCLVGLVVLAPLLLLLALILFAPTLERAEKKQPEAPYRGGAATVAPSRVVAGGEPSKITVSYRVGPDGIGEGGGIRLCMGRVLRFGPDLFKLCLQWGSEWGVLQRQSPGARDYIDVSASRGEVQLDVSLLENRVKRDLAGWAKRKLLQKIGLSLPKFNPKDAFLENSAVTVKVVGGELKEGDLVEFRLGEGAGLKVPDAPLESDFSLAVDLYGKGDYRLEASVPTVRVTGGTPERIEVVAPSLAAPGERAKILLRIVDKKGFLTPEYSGTVAISSTPGLQLPSEVVVPEGSSGAVWFEGSVIGIGVTRVYARDVSGGLEGESNPLVCEKDARRLLWGDTHTHSAISDATMDPGYLYFRAREHLGLGFTCVTEHDCWSTGEEYPRSNDELDLMIRSAEENYAPGEFVTFPAYEWTQHRQGHRNVIFGPGQRVEFAPHVDPRYGTAEDLLEALEGCRAIVIPHHPAWKTHAGEMRFDFGRPENPLQRLVEVYSRHGSSEYYGCPKPISHMALLEGRRGKLLRGVYREYAGPRSGSYACDALAAGHRLGFMAGSDEHLGGSDPRKSWAYVYGGGLTGVFCDSATREAVWDGLWNRRVCATTGARIFMELLVNGRPQGSELRADSSPVIKGRVVGTADVDLVELIKFDGESYSVPWRNGGNGSPEVAIDFTDDAFRRSSFYYLRVFQSDGHIGWAGPTWVDKNGV